MIIESFPAITMATVELEPANPQLRGRKLPSLKDRLKFGGPLFARITTDYHPDDADLQAFLHGSQERWVLAHLALGFPSSDGPPLATASVQVNLGDDGEPAETIAFSILPVAAGTPYEESEKFTINPHATVGHTVGISLGSFGRETVRRGQEVFLTGDGELTSRPAWHFKSTPTHKLAGSMRLSMILRVPNGRVGRISIDLSATVLDGAPFRRRQVPLSPQGSSDGHYEESF